VNIFIFFKKKLTYVTIGTIGLVWLRVNQNAGARNNWAKGHYKKSRHKFC